MSSKPSATSEYAACPTPARGHASCQSLVVPPAARLASVTGAAAAATTGVGGSGLSPEELQSAYELPSTVAGAGSEQTVAVVDAYDDPTAEADLAEYRSAYGLAPCTTAGGCFRKLDQSGGEEYPPAPTTGEGDWDLEISLDLDMVSAVCPNCHIVLVEASSDSFADLTTAEQEAVRAGATEISNSWAGVEFGEETSYDHDFDQPGIPITAASGDWGYDNRQLGGTAPSYPAASPYVIAVGGTVLAAAENSRHWSESAWEDSGSGCSRFEPKPSYQQDAGCPRRSENDVSAVAEDLSVYDTSHPQGSGNLPAWITVDGTSAATPIVAAVEALSEGAERSLGAAAFYRSPGSLHDILSGSDGACPQFYLCQAGGGYDGPSGNGTPAGALSASAAAPAPELTVLESGTGAGGVHSSPAGIKCPGICAAAFTAGSTVTLTATPAAGSSFEGWQGACTGSGSCTLKLGSSGASVQAGFAGSGAPAGWTVSPLPAPAGQAPLLPEANISRSFFDVSLSADGRERAETVYDPSNPCLYASDTGGVSLERQSGGEWTSEGVLMPPSVGSEPPALWANCAGFGEVTKLSGEGSTLLVTQQPAPAAPGYRCAAFVYRRSADGWQQEGTLFPPGAGPNGVKTWEGCNYFGIEGAISDDGSRVAVMGDGVVYVFDRTNGGWSLEQQIALSAGTACDATVGPRKLAMSGAGTVIVAGQPDCEVGGREDQGRAEIFTRSDSGWALAQTVDSPEALARNEFGRTVAISDDGSTIALAAGSAVTGLPREAGAAWVLTRGSEGWAIDTKLTATAPEQGAGFTCPAVLAGGARILCGTAEKVGSNPQQGALYAYERPAGGWSATRSAPQRAFASEGSAQESLGLSGDLYWRTFAASDDGAVVDAPISAWTVALGFDTDDRIGWEFTAPAAYSQPTIEAISPDAGPAGTVVSIAGTDLTGASAVSFGGRAAQSFEVRSPTRILATVPQDALSGGVSVSAPAGSATSPEGFRFEPGPTVASVEPSQGPTAGGTPVRILGSGFVAGATVTIGGGAAGEVTVRSASEITASTPAHAPGSYEVLVSDANGTSTGGPDYTFIAPPVPVVESVAPAEGPATGGTEIRIDGSGFQSGASVTIGGAAAGAVKVLSATEMTAVSGEHRAGSYEVVVSDGGGQSSGGPDFRYTGLRALTIGSLAPSTGPAKTPDAVTIQGTGFAAGLKVSIGGKAKTAQVISETEIQAVTGSERAGSDEVVVTLGHSRAYGPLFTFLTPPPPAVESISPEAGPTGGGTPVTISGTGFVAGAKVKLCGKSATDVAVASETELTAVTPSLRAGACEVSVRDRRGTSTGGAAFTYTQLAAGFG